MSQQSSMSDSSSPHIPTEATLIQQLRAAQAENAIKDLKISQMLQEGSSLVAEVKVLKSQVSGHTLAAASSSSTPVSNSVPTRSTAQVKIPIAPQFKGEVGFGVDTWIRRITKQFDYYGASQFPDAESRIRFAVMYLEGSAMDWWDKIPSAEKSTISSTWDNFVAALYSRFRPMQAAMIARTRLSNLKQTGSVAAYINLFQREQTPIDDMSMADQIFYFRGGLKSQIALRVLEKSPKTLHEAMDIAVLADAQTSKNLMNHVPQYNYSSTGRNAGTGHSAPRTHAASSNDMDLSNINHDGQDDVKPPVFHEEDSSSSSSNNEMMREFNRMKNEIKKYQTQAEISAIAGSSSSSSSAQPGRVHVSKEEFDYCFANRLCLKCKKPNHRAVDCRSKYQPLK
jgi:hypothetical protein